MKCHRYLLIDELPEFLVKCCVCEREQLYMLLKNILKDWAHVSEVFKTSYIHMICFKEKLGRSFQVTKYEVRAGPQLRNPDYLIPEKQLKNDSLNFTCRLNYN